MVWVTLGLGSNTEQVNNLRTCLDALLLQFKELKISSVFESKAVGLESNDANYYNLAVGFETDLALDVLSESLKKIEEKHGRTRASASAGSISLDIDILTFGNKNGTSFGITLPREDILNYAYVLWPLSQVAAKQKHPVLNQNYAALWKAFDGDRDAIKPVNFEWHGRKLSSAN